MIRSALVYLLLCGTAWAAPGDEGAGGDDAPAAGDAPTDSDDDSDDDVLSPHRTDFNMLMERTIGRASQPVAFSWRRTKAHVAATGSFLFELNNFNSGRVGAMGRFPMRGLIVELGVNYVFVGDTPSSRLLALTPYRQPGRPARMEIDATVAVPFAEGVVTAAPRFFPALQLVFNGYAGLRYSIYRKSWSSTMRVREVAGAIVSPRLSDLEIENLDDARLDAMAVDRGRYNLMLGFGNDIWFKQGIFVSPRMMFAVPLLAPASDTELLFWADISLAVGVGF